jgi:hypothetical protein
VPHRRAHEIHEAVRGNLKEFSSRTTHDIHGQEMCWPCYLDTCNAAVGLINCVCCGNEHYNVEDK